MRGLSLVVASGDHSSSRCAGLSLSQPLLLRSTGSKRAGSVIVAHRPSCSAACGIFPDQGSNPCPLHWQADSQPLRHQGSLCSFVFISWVLLHHFWVLCSSDLCYSFISFITFKCLSVSFETEGYSFDLFVGIFFFLEGLLFCFLFLFSSYNYFVRDLTSILFACFYLYEMFPWNFRKKLCSGQNRLSNFRELSLLWFCVVLKK